MLSLLLNSFLPVAFLILLGFVSAKKKVFDYKQSLAILKYVGVVAVPALTLKMIISINLSNLNWILLSGYILSELIIYIIAALLAKYIFKFEWHECILIGMAASFANHLLLVYPIALNEYNEALIAPIISIIGFGFFNSIWSKSMCCYKGFNDNNIIINSNYTVIKHSKLINLDARVEFKTNIFKLLS